MQLAPDFLRARKLPIRKDWPGIFQQLSYAKAQEVANELAGRFLAGDVDAVFLCYNEFKSAITQRVVVRQLLPIETGDAQEAATGYDFLYEPSREKLLEELVPKHLAIQVWRALLDSAQSVRGTWGSGRLIRTSLVSVLMTSDGRTFIGAVKPSVLYAAVARS